MRSGLLAQRPPRTRNFKVLMKSAHGQVTKKLFKDVPGGPGHWECCASSHLDLELELSSILERLR